MVNQSALQTVQPHTVACSGIQRWLQANQKHQRRTAQQQRLTLPAFGSPLVQQTNTPTTSNSSQIQLENPGMTTPSTQAPRRLGTQLIEA